MMNFVRFIIGTMTLALVVMLAKDVLVRPDTYGFNEFFKVSFITQSFIVLVGFFVLMLICWGALMIHKSINDTWRR